MNQPNYLKLFSLIAFVGFAAFSCWATAESLHLFQPSLHILVCWMIAVGFFIIAAIGTKMIVDSLNQNIYMERRTLRLISGIIIVLIFWIAMSMPTNTHTFLYRDAIGEKVSNDLVTSQKYVSQIANDQKRTQLIASRTVKLESEVKQAKDDLFRELFRKDNPGDSYEANKYRSNLAQILNCSSEELYIKPTEMSFKNLEARRALEDQYTERINGLTERRLAAINADLTSPEGIEHAKKVSQTLDSIKIVIDGGRLNINDPKEISKVSDILNDAYSVIYTNRDYVNFDVNDISRFNKKQPTSEVKRLISVYDVWTDIFKGKLGSSNFYFWLIISILIDVAAFVFFDIAFTKKEY